MGARRSLLSRRDAGVPIVNTFSPVRISTPSLARNSASSTVLALSVVGNNFPVSSRFSSTPISANQATVCSTVNVRSTLAMALRLPLKSSAATAWWVTLQRPPPEMRIFAPMRGAPSKAMMRASGFARGRR